MPRSVIWLVICFSPRKRLVDMHLLNDVHQRVPHQNVCPSDFAVETRWLCKTLEAGSEIHVSPHGTLTARPLVFEGNLLSPPYVPPKCTRMSQGWPACLRAMHSRKLLVKPRSQGSRKRNKGKSPWKGSQFLQLTGRA